MYPSNILLGPEAVRASKTVVTMNVEMLQYDLKIWRYGHQNRENILMQSKTAFAILDRTHLLYVDETLCKSLLPSSNATRKYDVMAIKKGEKIAK